MMPMMTFVKHKTAWTLAAILLIASVLRLYQLDRVPASPYWEETALGYDAYSIAKTGKDHHGNSYPIIAFPSFGDYKPSGYFYAIVPFIKIFGLNIWSVRLPSAIAGIVSVALVFLIAKELFGEKVALVAASMFAIQPWALQFSRAGWEVNLALTMILAGTFFLLRSRQKPFMITASVLFFGLSMYTYHAARLFSPLIGAVGGLWIIWDWFLGSKRHKVDHYRNRKVLSLTIASILLLVFLGPLLSNLRNKEVSSRFSDTSIFSNPQPVLDSNAAIAMHDGSRWAKILYHRYWYYANLILRQWVSHFSPSFLFVGGDRNLRHWNGLVGELYWADAPFILISLLLLVFSLRKERNLSCKLGVIVLWVMLAAIAPALVTPAPHALRFLFAAPAFALLSAHGVVWVFDHAKGLNGKKSFVVGLIFVYVFVVSRYLSFYYLVYPVISASDWQYGYQEMFSKVGYLKKADETVYISRKYGRPSMYYLFYSSYDPHRLQLAEPNLPKDQLELLRVDDVHFIDALSDSQRGIFALPANTILTGGKILTNVTDLSNNIVWTIWRRD
jgi:4-amino-4-deoxy-L-arabinose transferase-like glycosyltransferase